MAGPGHRSNHRDEDGGRGHVGAELKNIFIHNILLIF